jgi:hypothetical protein
MKSGKRGGRDFANEMRFPALARRVVSVAADTVRLRPDRLVSASSEWFWRSDGNAGGNDRFQRRNATATGL